MAQNTLTGPSTTGLATSINTHSHPPTDNMTASNHLPTSTSSDSDCKTSTSPCPSTATNTPTYKTKGEVQKIINSSPDLRNYLFLLLQATMAATETHQPQLLLEKTTKIEDLKAQLLQALEFGNAKTAEVDRLQASLKLATDTGLEQIEQMESQHAELQRLKQVEQNLRRGNMALQKALEPLKQENATLKRKVRDRDEEIRELLQRCEEQSRSVGILGHRAREAEQKYLGMEVEVDRLERENQVLVLKGEEMSGRLMSVAEEWHEPMQKKRGGNGEEIGEGERLRKALRRF
jgi:chromosome segregation ATPase